MNSEASELLAIQQRLARLERQNRLCRLLGLTALLLLVALFTTAQVGSRDVVEAREFLVRYPNGKDAIRISSDGRNPIFHMSNFDGTELTAISLGEISLFTSEGICLLSPSALTMSGSFGAQRRENVLELRRRPNTLSLPAPYLRLEDPNGFATVIGVSETQDQETAESSQTSAASIVMFDWDKRVIWKAP